MKLANRRLSALVLAVSAAATGVAACGDDKDDKMPVGDTGGADDNETSNGNTGSSGSTGSNSNGSTGGMTSKCPDEADRKVVTVSGAITSATEWKCENTYLLDGRIYVKGATLKIGAGTVIQGDETSALFITSDAKIEAIGTKEDPIVFTSFQPVGMRKASDWQGVVLLGKATINRTGGSNVFEGLDDKPEHRYGGNDDKHNCGTLKYVRIEYAGTEILPTKEVNGLSSCGCGSDTTLDYIQIHKSADDGVEFFGGTASIKHLVSSSYDDDGLDWDEGWRGNAQFVILQQPEMPSEEDPNGFEADNQKENNSAEPISHPTIYNATIIGGNAAPSFGMVLRRGTEGFIRNFILQGFKAGAIDVRDSLTSMNATGGKLLLESGILFNNGADGNTPFQNETGTGDDDSGFDEAAFFGNPALKIDIVDAKLGDAQSRTKPNFVPAADSPAKDNAATPSGAWFDASATYRGAIAPGGTDWTAGWTSYPDA